MFKILLGGPKIKDIKIHGNPTDFHIQGRDSPAAAIPFIPLSTLEPKALSSMPAQNLTSCRTLGAGFLNYKMKRVKTL